MTVLKNPTEREVQLKIGSMPAIPTETFTTIGNVHLSDIQNLYHLNGALNPCKDLENSICLSHNNEEETSKNYEQRYPNSMSDDTS
jgi:hypothetical protein